MAGSIDSSPYIISKIDAVQGGTATLESIVTNQEAILDATRSTSSTTTTLTNAEQVLYELVPTASSEFLGGNIDLTNLAANDAVTVNIYKKIKSGGAYVLCSTVTYSGVQAVPLIEIAGGRMNMYSIKVTAVQGTSGTSYKAIDHEWFDAAPGV